MEDVQRCMEVLKASEQRFVRIVLTLFFSGNVVSTFLRWASAGRYRYVTLGNLYHTFLFFIIADKYWYCPLGIS